MKTIRRLFTEFYETIKTVQQLRAEAILKGQHWY